MRIKTKIALIKYIFIIIYVILLFAVTAYFVNKNDIDSPHILFIGFVGGVLLPLFTELIEILFDNEKTN